MVQADNLDVLYDDDLQAYIEALRAKAEAFLNSCGKEDMEIYRIEQFEPVRQAKETEGKFYDGDSYVVLKQTQKYYDIHYWHGKDATSDEMGSSAALTVQLSDVLQKPSRHHLEEMEYETDLFMTYFKGGIFYLPGGVESGYKKVEANVHEPKLMHIKGKRFPRVFEVPIEANSLNDGDCFILDMGDKLYNWYGAECSIHERQKTTDMSSGIVSDERKMKAVILYPQEQGGDVEAEFWQILGGKPAKINPPVPDDAASISEDQMMMCKLFHLSDASGKLEINEVEERPLKRSHLNDDDTYILELYNQVYVWQGKGASKSEKQMGVKYARDFVKNNNKPKGTKISRIAQGCEDTRFKSFFEGFYQMVSHNFDNVSTVQGFGHVSGDQDINKVASQQAKVKQLVLDKLGSTWSKKVYHVDGKTPVEITDPAESGKFFAESNYIVDVKGEGHRYVFKWYGPNYNANPDGAIGAMSEAVVTLLGGVLTSDDTYISVKKGQEDETFLSFFPEGFAILDEQRIPMADWQAKSNQNGVMFRVQAPFGGAARSIEQNSRSSQYLNSGDAFVVIMPGFESAYVWHGPGANEEEKKGAQQVFDLFSRPAAIETMDEGQESEAFWDSVGGKGEYSHVKNCDMIPPGDFEPRLFSVSNTSGFMWMQEIPQFQQEDLINEDCFIMDAYSTVFVWVGALSIKQEKNGALKRAQKYIDGVNDTRDKSQVVIETIEAGHEPPMFRVQFVQWEPEVAQKWLDQDPREIARKKEEAAKANAPDETWGKYLNGNEKKFTYEELNGKFPEGVKPDAKEAYLTDEEFQTVFQMARSDFNKLSAMKKINKKKQVNLY